MSYVAVDKDKSEFIYRSFPTRQTIKNATCWQSNGEYFKLEKGSIEKLIGRKLTWEDEPVELKEQNEI